MRGAQATCLKCGGASYVDEMHAALAKARRGKARRGYVCVECAYAIDVLKKDAVDVEGKEWKIRVEGAAAPKPERPQGAAAAVERSAEIEDDEREGGLAGPESETVDGT